MVNTVECIPYVRALVVMNVNLAMPILILLLSLEGACDEMERLYIHLKNMRLSPTGELKPSTQKDFRTSFIRRCKNENINEKLHLVRILNSTLKVSQLLDNDLSVR